MRATATDSDGNTSEVFWGEISPCEHMVQIYEEDDAFLVALEGFVAAGIRSGEGVIVLATPAHLRSLEDRLHAAHIDVQLATIEDRYIALSAERTLATFMIDGWPDDYLFERVVTDLLRRAGKGGRNVRAFGEMVALLWADGHNGATVRMEHLWHQMCHQKGFSLFCAYPRIGFTKDAESSIKEICAAHSKVVHV
jgi:hypothetical protein